ncbi:PHD zinc finger-containing protein [Reticulomyxa filosa]|uniref:PHD zinc finger-containing protein n=1 Tax=Reticulomyxa filosa TaxID=46433 RepID=X6MFV2_RETFI|nr:PHD zinc finger-containing protein [Reticulomyxa filosa]|eukprot:ETO12307.1 PHD zinc finger-containing protein [Reticulomyxa filosa]
MTKDFPFVLILCSVSPLLVRTQTYDCNYVTYQNENYAPDVCFDRSLSIAQSYKFTCNTDDTITLTVYNGLGCDDTSVYEEQGYDHYSSSIKYKCNGNTNCYGMYTSYVMGQYANQSCDYDEYKYKEYPKEFFLQAIDCTGSAYAYVMYVDGCRDDYDDRNQTGKNVSPKRLPGSYYKYNVTCKLQISKNKKKSSDSGSGFSLGVNFGIVLVVALLLLILCLVGRYFYQRWKKKTSPTSETKSVEEPKETKKPTNTKSTKSTKKTNKKPKTNDMEKFESFIENGNTIPTNTSSPQPVDTSNAVMKTKPSPVSSSPANAVVQPQVMFLPMQQSQQSQQQQQQPQPIALQQVVIGGQTRKKKREDDDDSDSDSESEEDVVQIRVSGHANQQNSKKKKKAPEQDDHYGVEMNDFDRQTQGYSPASHQDATDGDATAGGGDTPEEGHTTNEGETVTGGEEGTTTAEGGGESTKGWVSYEDMYLKKIQGE